MTIKPLVPREKARVDVGLAVGYYSNEAGADVAFAFIAALEQAYALIGETPATGSARWSTTLNLPGLRTRQLKGFPWLVFYVELKTHVDVWRVPRAKRDIPAWVNDEDGG